MGAALVTVAVTLALQPVRRWLARSLRQRVGVERVAGGELLRRVGEALEYSHDPVELAPRLATTVREGMGVAWVRIWLEP